jgi:hypothetical protein
MPCKTSNVNLKWITLHLLRKNVNLLKIEFYEVH